MVRYSKWRQSLRVIFMAPNFTQIIFDPLSCTGTQWIVDKVMTEHYVHSVLICDNNNVRFPLDWSQATECPCTLFRVRCHPHSEGCDLQRGLITGVYLSKVLCPVLYALDTISCIQYCTLKRPSQHSLPFNWPTKSKFFHRIDYCIKCNFIFEGLLRNHSSSSNT